MRRWVEEVEEARGEEEEAERMRVREGEGVRAELLRVPKYVSMSSTCTRKKKRKRKEKKEGVEAFILFPALFVLLSFLPLSSSHLPPLAHFSSPSISCFLLSHKP